MYYDYDARSLDKRVTMEWDGSRSRGRELGGEKEMLDNRKGKTRVLMLTASWLPLMAWQAHMAGFPIRQYRLSTSAANETEQANKLQSLLYDVCLY